MKMTKKLQTENKKVTKLTGAGSVENFLNLHVTIAISTRMYYTEKSDKPPPDTGRQAVFPDTPYRKKVGSLWHTKDRAGWWSGLPAVGPATAGGGISSSG